MLPPIVPRRLRPGDELRVIAPSLSLPMISPANRALATARLEDLGLRVTFGEHVLEQDDFGSTSIEHRLADLHAAFADPGVAAILTVIGGANSNQLLPYLDWDLIAANPKVFCGYSDITALSCAITARTGLVTYSGPHYSTFAMRDHFEQTLAWFRSALWPDEPLVVSPAASWTDDRWFDDQDDRLVRPNEGHWTIAAGHAEGRLVGGNLCTLSLLQGTGSLPDLRGAIVFVEDDAESGTYDFDRDLTSLTQQPGFDRVRGLLIGRFQAAFGMTRATLEAIVRSKRELVGMPVVANVDFGHTDPMLTIPVGGTAVVEAAADGEARLTLASGFR